MSTGASEPKSDWEYVGKELADYAISAVQIWKQNRLEPLKLHFLDILQRRLRTIDDDENDRRSNGITELETCLEQWAERRPSLVAEGRKALQPLYDQLEPIVGSQGIDRLLLDRLQMVSDDLHVLAHQMLFEAIGYEPGAE